jgi:integrase
VLRRYLAERGHRWADRQTSPYVFVSNRGNRLDGAEVHRAFYALSRQIGLRGLSDSHGPRLHDMRHNSESRIIPSTASNDAVLPEEAGWEGSERCSE